MKKWEEEQRKKNYQTQIRKAKSSIGQHRNSKVNSSLNDSKSLTSKTPTRNLETGFSQRSQLADYFDFEKEDLNQIPLYRLLKMHNLQQYSKQLISRGFGYDITKFNYLTQKDLNLLFDDIKVLPGHKSKMMNLIDYINEIYSALSESNSKMMTTTPQSYNNFSTKSSNKQSMARNATISNYQQQQSFSTKNQFQQTQLKQASSVKQLNSQGNNNNNSKKSLAALQQQQQQRIRPQSGRIAQKLQPGQIQKQGSDGINSRQQQQGQMRLLKSIEPDFFRDSDDLDDEFSKALENIMNKYQPSSNEREKFLFQDPKNYEYQQKENNSVRNASNSMQSQNTPSQFKQPALQFDNSDLDFQDYQIPNNFPNSSKSQKSLQDQQQQKIQSKTANVNTNSFTSLNSQQSQKKIQQQQQQSKQKINNNNNQAEQADEKSVAQSTSSISSLSLTNQSVKESKDKFPQKLQQQKQVQQQQPKKNTTSTNQQQKQNMNQQLTNQPNAFTKKGKNVQQEQQVPQKNKQQQTGKKKQDEQFQLSKDDISLIPMYNERNQQELQLIENKILKNLKKHINNNEVSKEREIKVKDILNINLEVDKIKNLYLSYDSGKLTSTLVNLDIEELCFCLACALYKHIEYSVRQNDPNYNSNNNKNKKLTSIKEENDDQKSDSKKNTRQGEDSWINCSMKLAGKSLQKAQNDDSKLKMNPMEEPTQIQYSQSDIGDNIDVEKYLKESNDDLSTKQILGQQDNDKSDLQAISEKTVEASGQNGLTQFNQQNDQSNEVNNDVNYNNKQAFEQSRAEIENILKESILIKQQLIQQKKAQPKKASKPQQNQEIDNNNNNNSSHNPQQANEEQYQQQNQAESCFHDDQEEPPQQDVSQDYEDEDQQQEQYYSQKQMEKDLINNQEETKSDGDIEDQSELMDEEQQYQQYLQQQHQQQQQDDNEELDLDDSELAAEYMRRMQMENESMANKLNDVDDSELAAAYIRKMQMDNESLRNRLNAEPDSAGGDQEINYSQEKVDQTSLEFSAVSNCTTVVREVQNESEEINNRRLFVKTFNEQIDDKLLNAMPSKDVIQNYCKNILITAKMEKEAPIIALVYIERILIKSGFTLTMSNWRKITFTAMIMAGKIWDDESFENENFAIAFPMFSTKQINEMERVFLNFIDYNLYINQKDYAKYYFILRAFAEKSKKSFPLRPLDLKTIIYLQNNSNRAQRKLREIYSSALNKSF